MGLAIGAGIAVVDGTYAACGAAGAAPLLDIEPVRLLLGLAGGALLIVIGLRTLHAAFRVRLGLETADEMADPGRAFLASVAGTASNPATIASWAAIFAAASTAGAAPTTSAAVLLIVGVALGSLAWVSALAERRRDRPPRAGSAGDAAGGRRRRPRDARLRRRPGVLRDPRALGPRVDPAVTSAAAVAVGPGSVEAGAAVPGTGEAGPGVAGASRRPVPGQLGATGARCGLEVVFGFSRLERRQIDLVASSNSVRAAWKVLHASWTAVR